MAMRFNKYTPKGQEVDKQLEHDLMSASEQAEHLPLEPEIKELLHQILITMFYLKIKGLQPHEFQKVIDDFKYDGHAPWTEN